MNKVTDYDLLEFEQDDSEKILCSYLRQAIIDLQRKTKIVDLSYDTSNKTFTEELDSDVIEMLAVGMMFAWVNPHVANTEKMQNILNTKDMSQYSPAELLKQLQALRDSLKYEFRQSVISYTYENGDIENVR